jgi:hypothetical protein
VYIHNLHIGFSTKINRKIKVAWNRKWKHMPYIIKEVYTKMCRLGEIINITKMPTFCFESAMF